MREAREEACATIVPKALLAVYSIPRISQVQMMYISSLSTADIAPGPESTDVALLRWSEIPWDEIAFPSVYWALAHYQQVHNQGVFAPFTNPDGQNGDFDLAAAKSLIQPVL